MVLVISTIIVYGSKIPDKYQFKKASGRSYFISNCFNPGQMYFALAPEDVQTPKWIINNDVGKDCPWIHVPVAMLPPCCVPLQLRDKARAMVTRLLWGVCVCVCAYMFALVGFGVDNLHYQSI